jgi:hypothetical protein
MRNKKGAELSVNTLIIIILAIIVLVVLLFIFSSAARQFAANIFTNLNIAMRDSNATQLPQLPSP